MYCIHIISAAKLDIVEKGKHVVLPCVVCVQFTTIIIICYYMSSMMSSMLRQPRERPLIFVSTPPQQAAASIHQAAVHTTTTVLHARILYHVVSFRNRDHVESMSKICNEESRGPSRMRDGKKKTTGNNVVPPLFICCLLLCLCSIWWPGVSSTSDSKVPSYAITYLLPIA